MYNYYCRGVGHSLGPQDQGRMEDKRLRKTIEWWQLKISKKHMNENPSFKRISGA